MNNILQFPLSASYFFKSYELVFEGIGPTYAQKLVTAGITTTENLLEKGATPAGREELSEKTGIAKSLILEWVNLSDLLRIKGVGEEYSDARARRNSLWNCGYLNFPIASGPFLLTKKKYSGGHDWMLWGLYTE
jgi:hypothetical protein